ncbi:MAG: hypothetical protein AAF943_11400 [Pseudomonadota bacterium]
MQRLLWLASSQARACLILGLVGGLAFPRFAAVLVPWLPHMVAVLLTVTALRIGPQAAKGALVDVPRGLAAVIGLQAGLPLVFYALLSLAGVAQTQAGMAIVLVTAAPAISGSINLALLMGLDAGRMMQVLVLGTAAFPLTLMPVLAALPQLGAVDEILAASLRLLAVICGATALGFALRAWCFPKATEGQVKALDGLSVLAFSFIVVGLMAALTPALMRAPSEVLAWTLLAFSLGFGLQFLVLLMLRRNGTRHATGPLALAAGNRNIAIFLVALPAEVLAPLMIFIGCWQLPMYLTPILLPRLYRWALPRD